MERGKAKVQTQQEFLREAMQSLGLTRAAFAVRIQALRHAQFDEPPSKFRLARREVQLHQPVRCIVDISQ